MNPINKAKSLLTQGEHDLAWEVLMNAVNAGLDTPELHCQIGSFISNSTGHRSAINAYCRALELKPGYLPAIYNLALRSSVAFYAHQLPVMV